MVASAQLHLCSLQFHKALLLSGAAGGTWQSRARAGEELAVLLQLQDVLECACSCSAHEQTFLFHSCGLPGSPHVQK